MFSDPTELGRLHLYGDNPAGPQGAMCHLRPRPSPTSTIPLLPPPRPPRWQFLLRRPLSAESLRGKLSM